MTNEFNNDKVTAIVERKPSCMIEMQIKAKAPLIKDAKLEAVKAVGKEVELPGFRRGKAPEEMILKKYPAQVEKETHSKLADLAFSEAEKLAKVPLLNNNARITFDLKKMSEDVAELVFQFETEPLIPTVDPKQFAPKPVKRAEVGEKEIEEAIRQMRFFFASWKEVSDRPIQEKDYIMIDLDTLEGESATRVFNQVRFEVSKERMAKWMQDLVIGAKVGDVREGTSEPDEDATEEEKKEFLPKKVRIKVLKLEEATLPSLDEEFAKKVGAKDLVHMRQSITDMLNRQRDEKAQELLREQVNAFLIKNYPFELPHSLIATEKEHRQKQLLQNANFRKDWENLSEDDRKKLLEKIEAEAMHSVQIFYLSRQIVRDANIGITYQDAQHEAIAMMRSHGKELPQSIDQIPKEVFAIALSKVILAKAQDYIIKNSSNK